MRLNNLLQTDNVIKISPQDSLSSALNRLSSSHDAAFVFDDQDKYLGLINPYYSMIKTSSPANAKVTHCLFHAPRVKLNYSISRIAQLMIESKIHYLPVFDDKENFLGIVSARGLLDGLKYLDIFTIRINELLQAKKKPLVTVLESDLISTALNIFRNQKISKLIVVNNEMRLRGVLSHYDLITFLASPKTRERRGERAGDRTNIYNRQVKNFSKSYVLTLDEKDYARDVLHLILEKKIGSVIIVNDRNNPKGIITTKDLLGLLVRTTKNEKLELISHNLSKKNRQTLSGFFKSLSLSIKRKPKIDKARLLIQEEKQGNLFKVILSLFSRKGKPKVIQQEGRSLEKILKKIKKS